MLNADALEPAALANPRDAAAEGEILDTIRHALRGLRFGQVVVIVQDGVVVQVDRTERKRLRMNKQVSPK
jgi:hypothetical protein